MQPYYQRKRGPLYVGFAGNAQWVPKHMCCIGAVSVLRFLSVNLVTKSYNMPKSWPYIIQIKKTSVTIFKCYIVNLPRRNNYLGLTVHNYHQKLILAIFRGATFFLTWSWTWPNDKLFRHCTLYSVHCTVYISQCTLYTVHCTVYSVHCTVYILQCTLYIVQCTLYTNQFVFSIESFFSHHLE
jgi:hypothetical protein